jgi:hypothetical protein
VALFDDIVGVRHVHLPAHTFGSELGKAVSIRESFQYVQWQAIDVDDKGRVLMKPNETNVVYRSPLSKDVPPTKRAVRLPPAFIHHPPANSYAFTGPMNNGMKFYTSSAA